MRNWVEGIDKEGKRGYDYGIGQMEGEKEVAVVTEEAKDRRFRGNKNYDVKHMWEQHREIIRQVVLGHSNVAIAENLQITPQTVSNVRNNPVAKQVIQEHSKERDDSVRAIVQRMEEFAPIAERLLEDIIKGVVDAPLALRAKYADKHLGRVGLGEVKKIQSLRGTLTHEDIADLKLRALNAARESGMLVEDVVYEVQK